MRVSFEDVHAEHGDFLLLPTLTVRWMMYNEISLRWGFWSLAVWWWKKA